MDLVPGMLVNPNVRLVEVAGEGGMGSVWLADHLTLETQVAVKFILGERAENNPTAIARFKREAESAAKLKSPHVVQNFDHGVTDDGIPYIVMELLDGETVAERVEDAGAMGPRETAKVVRQVALVLAEAHSLGIIHRDIKPDNLFLIEGGYDIFVKVFDFGIAKSVVARDSNGLPRGGLVTADGALVGTLAFMSPEQIESPSTADYRVDLWALTVVAYYCFTGRFPFEGETIGAVAIHIAEARYRRPSATRSGLPDTLDAWFATNFDVDVEARFQSGKEMADALEALVEEWMADLDSSAPQATDVFEDLIPQSAQPNPLMTAAGVDERTGVPATGEKTTTDGFGSPASTTAVGGARSPARWIVGTAAVLAVGGVVMLAPRRPAGTPTVAASSDTATSAATSTVTASVSVPTASAVPPPVTPSATPSSTRKPKKAAPRQADAHRVHTPPTAGTPTAKESAKPAYCKGETAFVIKDGIAEPKPECM